MKSTAFEKHHVIEDIQKETTNTISTDPKGVSTKVMLEGLEKETGFTDADRLSHRDERIQFMNNQDVQIQVLSHGNSSPSNLAGQRAIGLCQKVNDQLANHIVQRLNRFVGSATLPIDEPRVVAREFERCANDLGFKDTSIMGRIQDGLLDQDKYDIIFKTAGNLDVSIYLRPALINSDIYQPYYKGNYPEATAVTLTCSGYGWRIGVGIHAIRLVLSDTFDRHPKLNVIIGHWGEFIPFFLEHMDRILSTEHLNRPVSYYFKNSFYITSSGMLTKPQFGLVKKEVGIDRILYATDYPYTGPEKLGIFLGELGLADEEEEKMSYANGTKLLDLSPNSQQMEVIEYGDFRITKR